MIKIKSNITQFTKIKIQIRTSSGLNSNRKLTIISKSTPTHFSSITELNF